MEGDTAPRPSQQVNYLPHNNMSTSTSDVLDELDDLRGPLYAYAQLMEQMKSSYCEKVQEIRHMINTMRDSFLAMFLGLSILHTIEDEVRPRSISLPFIVDDHLSVIPPRHVHVVSFD